MVERRRTEAGSAALPCFTVMFHLLEKAGRGRHVQRGKGSPCLSKEGEWPFRLHKDTYTQGRYLGQVCVQPTTGTDHPVEVKERGSKMWEV